MAADRQARLLKFFAGPDRRVAVAGPTGGGIFKAVDARQQRFTGQERIARPL